MVVEGSTPGLTSRTFHTLIWVLVLAAILENGLVLGWRFSKETRFQLRSLLIVSLGVADLLWCCHCLIEESIVFNSVFSAGGNETLNFTIEDQRLCLASSFFLVMSSTAMMLTAVAIALHTVLAVHGCRHGNIIVYLFISISWMTCLAVGVSATLDLKRRMHQWDIDFLVMSRKAFSLQGMFYHHGLTQYAALITIVSVTATVFCAIVYSFLCYKLKRSIITFRNSEVKHLQIRMIIIVVVNLIAWWPSIIIYWYSYITDETLSNKEGVLDAYMLAHLLIAIVPVVNPIIYTIASKSLIRQAKRCCIPTCCHANEERRELLALGGWKDDRSLSVCFAIRNCLSQAQRKLCTTGESQSGVTSSEATESSSLFTE